MDRRTFITSGTSAWAGLAITGNESLAMPVRPTHQSKAASDTQKVLQLNHNSNPLGLPPGARQAILETLEEVPHYPRARRGQLRTRLAELHGLSAGQVILGAGSTELIRCAIQAHASTDSRLLQAHPTYENAIEYGEPFPYRVERVALTNDSAHNIDRMKALAAQWKEPTVVYICNPHNPTGTLTPSAEVDDWIASATDNVFFVIDEAYFPFVADASYWSADKWVHQKSNVLVTRTFSKLYGMAGLRIGYGLCAASTAQRLELFANHSRPNMLALAGALAALEDASWTQKSLAIWEQCREVVTNCLDELELKYFPSHTAFLFHEIRGDQAEYRQRMSDHDILVGRSFPPLLSFNRLSLSATPDELERFTDTLRKFRRNGWV